MPRTSSIQGAEHGAVAENVGKRHAPAISLHFFHLRALGLTAPSPTVQQRRRSSTDFLPCQGAIRKDLKALEVSDSLRRRRARLSDRRIPCHQASVGHQVRFQQLECHVIEEVQCSLPEPLTCHRPHGSAVADGVGLKGIRSHLFQEVFGQRRLAALATSTYRRLRTLKRLQRGQVAL